MKILRLTALTSANKRLAIHEPRCVENCAESEQHIRVLMQMAYQDLPPASRRHRVTILNSERAVKEQK